MPSTPVSPISFSIVRSPLVSSPNWSALTLTNGVGMMHLQYLIIYPNDITAAYLDLTAYDEILVPPRGCTLNLTTGRFTIDYPAVWEITLTYFATATETQQSRTYELQLFNVTEGVALDPVSVGLGRNSQGLSVTLPLMLVFDETDIGDVFVFQVGKASATIEILRLDMLSLGLKQVAI